MFRAQFPEFGNVSDTLVTAMLGAAFLDLSPCVWGQYGVVGGNMTKADQGQMYLTAHKLCMSPFGQNARMMVNNKSQGYEKTTYGSEFLLLLRSVTSGFRVA